MIKRNWKVILFTFLATIAFTLLFSWWNFHSNFTRIGVASDALHKSTTKLQRVEERISDYAECIKDTKRVYICNWMVEDYHVLADQYKYHTENIEKQLEILRKPLPFYFEYYLD